MQNSLRKLITLTIATLLAGLFGTAAGFAAVVAATGGPLLRVDTKSSTDPATTSSASFVNVPNSGVRIVIPTAGGSRLVVARFSAESDCTSTGEGTCSLRIIAVKLQPATPGVVTEMHPQAALDFVFESVLSIMPLREGQTFERSLRLEPGSYLIAVQRAVSTVLVTFHLDDWHLTVSQYD